jgi:hypothetical protein
MARRGNAGAPKCELVLRSDFGGRGLCGLNADSTQRETILRPGETKHFRLSVEANGNPEVQRAPPQVREK